MSHQVRKSVYFVLSGLALLLAFVFPTSLNSQSNPSQVAPITKSDEIFLNVNITNNEGKVLAGLPAERFSLYLGKEPQKINYFTNKSLPASVLILFDMTGSMRSSPLYKDIGVAKEAFTRFFKASDPANEYTLLSFGSVVKPVQDWTGDINAILAGFDKIALDRPSGTSMLVDLCLEGIEKLRSQSRPRRVILLVTDIHNDLDSKLGKLRRPLQETNSLIYLVHINKLNNPVGADSALDMDVQTLLQQAAELSGGMILFPQTQKDFAKSLEWIATDLRDQYLLSFQPPTSVKVDKEYPLKVTLNFSPDTPKEVRQMKVRQRQFFIGHNR